MKIMELTVKEYNKIMKDNTLKFGNKVTITKTNCDDVQGFIISEDGIEPIEDKDIPPIPDDELYEISKYNPLDIKPNDEKMDYNFKVLKEKINQLVEEFNNHIKENK